MPNNFNPAHFLVYHVNSALASPHGRDMINSIKDQHPQLHEELMKHVNTHEQIMKSNNWGGDPTGEKPGPVLTTGVRG